jgi:hypothetical protein
VNSTRATLAIARRHMRPTWIVALAARIAVGIATGFLLVPTTSPWVVYVVALFYAALAGAELRIRDLMYFAAPLYGRQLARAHALTAVTAALAPPVAFFVVEALRGTPWSWTAMLATFVACVVAALVGLSVSLRRGNAATGYFVVALVAAGAILALFTVGVPIYGWLAFALLLGFLALRAFGETLARYDPLE